MQLTLPGQLKQFLCVMQGALFPAFEEQLGPLTDKLQQLVMVLGMIENSRKSIRKSSTIVSKHWARIQHWVC